MDCLEDHCDCKNQWRAAATTAAWAAPTTGNYCLWMQVHALHWVCHYGTCWQKMASEHQYFPNYPFIAMTISRGGAAMPTFIFVCHFPCICHGLFELFLWAQKVVYSSVEMLLSHLHSLTGISSQSLQNLMSLAKSRYNKFQEDANKTFTGIIVNNFMGLFHQFDWTYSYRICKLLHENEDVEPELMLIDLAIKCHWHRQKTRQLHYTQKVLILRYIRKHWIYGIYVLFACSSVLWNFTVAAVASMGFFISLYEDHESSCLV